MALVAGGSRAGHAKVGDASAHILGGGEGRRTKSAVKDGRSLRCQVAGKAERQGKVMRAKSAVTEGKRRDEERGGFDKQAVRVDSFPSVYSHHAEP